MKHNCASSCTAESEPAKAWSLGIYYFDFSIILIFIYIYDILATPRGPPLPIQVLVMNFCKSDVALVHELGHELLELLAERPRQVQEHEVREVREHAHLQNWTKNWEN